MKKLILTAVVLMMSFVTINAQEGLKGGAYLGVPSGDSSETFGVNYGANISYHYPVFENLWLGGIAGLDLFSGKDIPGGNLKHKGLTLLPIGLSGQFNLNEQFFVTLDLGVSLSLSKDYKGGFFFQPKGGWQNDFVQIFAFIKNVSSELDTVTQSSSKNFNNITSIGVGGAYKF